MFNKLFEAIATSFFNSEELLQIKLSEEEVLADLSYGTTEASESFSQGLREGLHGASQ